MTTSADAGKSYHHGNLRVALLEAGYHLLATRGVHGFSLTDCCKEAGVSKGAPYRHFANKEALLVEIAIAGFDRFRDQLLAARDVPPEEALRHVARTYIRFAQDHPAYVLAMFGSELDRRTHPRLETAARAMFNEVGMTIVRCQKTQVLPDDDPIYRSLTLWLPMHGLAMVLINGSERQEAWVQQTERLVEDLISILIRGSRTGPAPVP